MRTKFTLFLLLIFITSIKAQVETSANTFQSASYPTFYVDIANYKSDTPGKTRVDIFVQVPYSNVQFIRTPKGFKAKYSVHLTFFDEDKESIMIEKIWNETVEAKSFEETNSERNYNYSYRTFDLNPGKYNVLCNVTDKDSKKTADINAVVNVAKFDKEINISDLIFIAGKIKDVKGDVIIPNISSQIMDTDSSIAFFFDVYSDSARTLTVKYSIKDKNGEAIFSDLQPMQVLAGTNSIIHSIANKEFALGKFMLNVRLSDGEGNEYTSTTKPFYLTIFGFPRTITDIDEAIEEMEYIASHDEIAFIKSGGTRKEKLKRFKAFWRKKDPTKNTVKNEHFIEYYRRIEYANAHFESYYKGWRTDMGMVYVMLGAPDAVERHPFEINSKPYEVWDYYELNRRFVFVDQTGFGDFRLLNRNYGDWYRYRY